MTFLYFADYQRIMISTFSLICYHNQRSISSFKSHRGNFQSYRGDFINRARFYKAFLNQNC